ncbi:hypothetical protein [Gulosibacter sp. ACHW.36C]|nr:hypothetical protein [Gulosibacter sediminis]
MGSHRTQAALAVRQPAYILVGKSNLTGAADAVLDLPARAAPR